MPLQAALGAFAEALVAAQRDAGVARGALDAARAALAGALRAAGQEDGAFEDCAGTVAMFNGITKVADMSGLRAFPNVAQQFGDRAAAIVERVVGVTGLAPEPFVRSRL